jgi:hypothetical protein
MPKEKITTGKVGDNIWAVHVDDFEQIGFIEHRGRGRWRATTMDRVSALPLMPTSRAKAIQHLRMARAAAKAKAAEKFNA